MEIKNSYFYFQKALTPGQCEDIINLGKNQIEENNLKEEIEIISYIDNKNIRKFSYQRCFDS